MATITQEMIDRINVLARKSKAEGLTPEEKEEQAGLRKAYIEAFHNNLRGTLNTIKVKNPDGTIVALKDRDPERKRHDD